MLKNVPVVEVHYAGVFCHVLGDTIDGTLSMWYVTYFHPLPLRRAVQKNNIKSLEDVVDPTVQMMCIGIGQ